MKGHSNKVKAHLVENKYIIWIQLLLNEYLYKCQLPANIEVSIQKWRPQAPSSSQSYGRKHTFIDKLQNNVENADTTKV